MDTTYTHTLRDCALILYPGSENRSEYQLIKVIQWYLHKLYFTSFTPACSLVLPCTVEIWEAKNESKIIFLKVYSHCIILNKYYLYNPHFGTSQYALQSMPSHSSIHFGSNV